MAKNEMYSVLTVTDIVSETNTQKTRNSMIGSVKKNGLTLEKLPDGFRATFEFPEYSYTIPMDFILVGDSLKVSVDTSKIIEKGEQRLFSLRILPYFGAQDWETDGYFILPDGSGSLLRFNNGKGRFTYRSDLYGLDGVVKQDSRDDQPAGGGASLLRYPDEETGAAGGRGGRCGACRHPCLHIGRRIPV